MRYYSTQRPVAPGSFPKPIGNKALEIHNFDSKSFCGEIGREAWGYIEYQQPLAPGEAEKWELTPEGRLWFPVTISSHKHGGGLRVASGQPVKATQRPGDTVGDTRKMQLKTRYFSTWEEAQRVMHALQSLDITTERIRRSATQGEVKVYINGKYILNFGDNIVLPKHGDDLEDYYGDDISGWRSSQPDSSFVLGLIWNPFDFAYHYSDKICRVLGTTQEEWVEGNYWNREGRVWKPTEN